MESNDRLDKIKHSSPLEKLHLYIQRVLSIFFVQMSFSFARLKKKILK